ncbi:DUF1007 family protein [Reinekea blandensis]|uniref:DUF1007 family protein n=1 Tax=Reinekea blandensis MED297 TaxID=314283 RepID=A4BG24_9GAMM|nr:DUF1007 family protein [Reinekea blandensis]EAR08819.1 hypothetical protein MED297_04097 [Reinekea sp. MED297] [Reinekea blandensis MED297]
MKRLLLMVCCLWPTTALLHPHSWINLTTDFVIDDQEQLAQVRQRWIFDEFYSAMMLADLDREYPTRELALLAHGNDMIASLSQHGFFSHLVLAQNQHALPSPAEHQLSVVTTQEADMLVLEMVFDLSSTPLPVSELSWQVYDPTYYVSMRHDDVERIRIHNRSSLECMPNLIEPNPTEEQMNYASSLDQTQKDTDGLGRLFAQKVIVQCV